MAYLEVNALSVILCGSFRPMCICRKWISWILQMNGMKRSILYYGFFIAKAEVP